MYLVVSECDRFGASHASRFQSLIIYYLLMSKKNLLSHRAAPYYQLFMVFLQAPQPVACLIIYELSQSTLFYEERLSLLSNVKLH